LFCEQYVPPQPSPVLQVSVVSFVTCHFICHFIHYLSFHLSFRVAVGMLAQLGLQVIRSSVPAHFCMSVRDTVNTTSCGSQPLLLLCYLSCPTCLMRSSASIDSSSCRCLSCTHKNDDVQASSQAEPAPQKTAGERDCCHQHGKAINTDRAET